MRVFMIDADNNVTAYAAAEQAPEGQERFASEKELMKLSAGWPTNRLLELWNSFAGVTPFDDLRPVKKFTDRKTAVARLWKALQRLEAATPATQTADEPPKAKRSRKEATSDDGAPTAREGSKKAIVLEMIRRPDGASVKEIMEATSWLPHSVRGFISGGLVKKGGLNIESFKRESGDRAYRLR